ncbi:MAG: YhfC family glutamic-type intramembrane protease [Butyribacter sp.]|nr:YhfC family glutamic-type intramembrane protease [Butyribacter sp.]
MPESISINSIIMMGVTAAILFFLPVIVTIVWKKKMGEKVSWKSLLIGAVGFFVTVRVLELGVHMVCLVLDTPISRFINGNTVAFVLYGIFMAGIFEECGRYIIIKYIVKKNKTTENMIMYGIGHGGMEVWAISLLTVISNLAMAIMLNTLGVEAFMKATAVTAENQATATTMMNQIGTFGFANGAVMVMERVFCMVIHICLTLVVFYGIKENKKIYLPLAILAHATFDLFPALYQRGIGTMWMTELWLAFCGILLVLWCIKLFDFCLIC